MLIGFQNGTTTFVVAASSVDVLTSWWNSLPSDFDQLITDKRQADFVDLLAVDGGLFNWDTPIYIFEHTDSVTASRFIELNQIEIVSIHTLDDHRDVMVKDIVRDNPLALIDGSRETIRELHGLDEHDKWDTRTEAEKEQQIKIDKLQQQAGDQLTGNSFSPRPSNSKGAIKVTDVKQDNQGNLDVLARKQHDIGNAEFSGAYDFVFDLDQVDIEVAKQTAFDVAAKLDPNDTELADKITELFATTEIHDELRDLAKRIVYSLTHQAWFMVQEPINVTTTDEAIEVIEERLKVFEGVLVPETIKEMLDVSVANINAPTPKPEDFTFTFNEKLTAAPSMRGIGTPIFNFGVNETGPNNGMFSIRQAIPYLERFGLSHVSVPLFSYEVDPTDVNYKADIRQALIDFGFIETNDNIPAPIVPERDGEMLAPEEFERYFAGDGTSAVDGTSYNGEAIVGKSEKDYAVEMEPGFGEKGANLQQDTDMHRVSISKIMQPMRDYLIKVGLTESDHIEIGKFNGYVFNDVYRVLTLEAEDTIIDDMSYNLDYNGASVTENGTKSVVLSKKNNASTAVLVIKNDGVYRIYKM